MHEHPRVVAAAGPVDVLVNNAGLGLFGAFEATPLATVRKIFEANTFGTMAMCQAFIPQWRERRSGIVVNVTSSATLAPFPREDFAQLAGVGEATRPVDVAHTVWQAANDPSDRLRFAAGADAVALAQARRGLGADACTA